MEDHYDNMFKAHDRQRDKRLRNGEYLAEIVCSYVAPRSVVDVGCGLGFFLRAMQARGADIKAIDADWVVPLATEIDKSLYSYQDLNEPLQISKRYDLAVSLEVAEHLLPERGESFVADLCALSDVVMFSAAVPGQRGSGHIHMQWQDWWAERFGEHGYSCYDPIRRKIAAKPDAFDWFAQNTLLFVKDGTEIPATLQEHRIEPQAAAYVGRDLYLRKQKFLRKRINKIKAEAAK